MLNVTTRDIPIQYPCTSPKRMCAITLSRNIGKILNTYTSRPCKGQHIKQVDPGQPPCRKKSTCAQKCNLQYTILHTYSSGTCSHSVVDTSESAISSHTKAITVFGHWVLRCTVDHKILWGTGPLRRSQRLEHTQWNTKFEAMCSGFAGIQPFCKLCPVNFSGRLYKSHDNTFLKRCLKHYF